MKDRRLCGGLLLIALMVCSCIEPYDPPLKETNVNYLVVEAFLDGTEGIATVRLSRTIPVKSDENIPAETNALVFIEDEQGATFLLDHGGAGIYHGTVNNINDQNKYRIVVRTGDAHEYVSTYTNVMKTPPIDSITWSVHRDGIQFEVNTHDPTDQARFFKWTFTETYEYHSKLYSKFKFTPDREIVERTPEEQLTYCWKTNESKGLIVGSAKHLQKSVLSKFPVKVVPYGSIQLTAKYSMLLKQQALTEEVYNYWHELERSTEQLGGLFDPLPTEVLGNIRCIHHKDERVLGVFSASTVAEQRIFLSRSQLPLNIVDKFLDRSFCPADTVLLPDLEFLPDYTLFIDEVYGLGPDPIGYTYGSSDCADCTSKGGQTSRPPFWE